MKLVSVVSGLEAGGYLMKKTDQVAWVFGYGSLVSEGSRNRTLGYSQGGCLYGTLNGIKRTYSATGMLNNANNAKHFLSGYDKNGWPLLPAFNPVFLNIRPDPGSTCWGVFIPVSNLGLGEFDLREANYNRTDVTALVDPESLVADSGLPVFAYTAKSSALLRTALPTARIASPYHEAVGAAFDEQGMINEYLNNTEFCVDTISVNLNIEEY